VGGRRHQRQRAHVRGNHSEYQLAVIDNVAQGQEQQRADGDADLGKHGQRARTGLRHAQRAADIAQQRLRVISAGDRHAAHQRQQRYQPFRPILRCRFLH